MALNAWPFARGSLFKRHRRQPKTEGNQRCELVNWEVVFPKCCLEVLSKQNPKSTSSGWFQTFPNMFSQLGSTSFPKRGFQ